MLCVSVMLIMFFPTLMVLLRSVISLTSFILFTFVFISRIRAIGCYKVAFIIIVWGSEGNARWKRLKLKSKTDLRAGGLCPPTHLFPPEWIPSQAFLFLDTRRVVAWSGGGPRGWPPFPVPSRQVTVIPLAPPVRCICRRKLKRSYKNKEFMKHCKKARQKNHKFL